MKTAKGSGVGPTTDWKARSCVTLSNRSAILRFGCLRNGDGSGLSAVVGGMRKSKHLVSFQVMSGEGRSTGSWVRTFLSCPDLVYTPGPRLDVSELRGLIRFLGGYDHTV